MDEILRRPLIKEAEEEAETQEWVAIKNEINGEWQSNHSFLDHRSILDALSNEFRSRLSQISPKSLHESPETLTIKNWFDA